MRKIIIFFGLIIAIFMIAGIFWHLRPVHKRPNIVLIVADTLRADHLPFYGYNRTDTPFLASMANRSILFEHTWAPSSWTSPSTASIFTSLYPFQHGVLRNFITTKVRMELDPKLLMARLPTSATTLAEILKNAGYKTFGISMNTNITKELNFNQGFDRFVYKKGKDADIANSQLREWKKEIQSAQPSFVYVQYMDCHFPYGRISPWYKPGPDKESNQMAAYDMAAYDSEICYLDRRIQEMSRLFGWENDTLFIFTSDHGEEFKEHGHFSHGATLYRETIQVPLFIVLPEKITPRRVTANVTLLDILPTIRDYLDLENDKDNAGISLQPYWKTPHDPPAERAIFSHLSKMKQRPKKKNVNIFITRAVLFKNWHAIFSIFPSSKQLFDWRVDYMEQENKLKQYPGFGQNLISKFLQFEKSCLKLIQDNVVIQLDAKKIRELKTLGYVE
jgi:arylsulfatase A-like enzyme